MKEFSKVITFFGKQAKVACDGKCHKAWGRNQRKRKEDETFFMDDELGIAPIDPGTCDGGDAKPISNKYFPNKWCVRECERCGITKYGESIDSEVGLPKF